jgi:hypothetical protein
MVAQEQNRRYFGDASRWYTTGPRPTSPAADRPGMWDVDAFLAVRFLKSLSAWAPAYVR